MVGHHCFCRTLRKPRLTMGRKRKLLWKSAFAGALIMAFTFLLLKQNDTGPAYDPQLVESRPYLINASGYQLPDFDPFDPSVKQYIIEVPVYDCSNGKRPLTSSASSTYGSYEEVPCNDTFCSSSSAGRLIFHEEHLPDYGVSSAECCYSPIKRDATNKEYPDNYYLIEKCHPLTSAETFVTANSVIVTCKKGFITIYETVHHFIQVGKLGNITKSGAARMYHKIKKKKSVNLNKLLINSGSNPNFDAKSDSEHYSSYPPHPPLSIMIVGLDSISRLNMQRYLPNTMSYLEAIEAINLRGYNKHADNTLPNLLPFLTGRFYMDFLFTKDLPRYKQYFDDIQFIWKNFSAKGYTTAYGEDCSVLGTYSYYDQRRGFKKPPTDFYLRPYALASEEMLGNVGGIVWFSKCKYCIGPRYSQQVMTNYAHDLSISLQHLPYFSFVWSTATTHDYLHFSGLADEPVYDLLSKMVDGGYWNNTIAFLISDHGIRFGDIRTTYIGRREEALPFGFIILPLWFKRLYPLAVENLSVNQFRLTTHFDMYDTLADILHERYKDDSYLSQDHPVINPPIRLSLFRKIPQTRNCLNAKIPMNYCSGMKIQMLEPSHPVVESATQYVIEKLNEGLSSFQSCCQLSLINIHSASVASLYRQPNDSSQNNEYVYYEMQFSTVPGNALLEATVKTNEYNFSNVTPLSRRVVIQGKEKFFSFSIEGTVSRINSYAGQSDCISDSVFQLYCYCKKLV